MNDELQSCLAGINSMKLGHDSSHLNLVLISLNLQGGFAGQTTAVSSAVMLAESLALPLRIFVLKRRPANANEIASETREYISGTLGLAPNPIEIFYLDDLGGLTFSSSDRWLVTFWMTAFAVNSLVEQQKIPVRSIIYLIQDFEPGFYPFGSEYAQALSTYDAESNWLVNSSSLAGYLSSLGYSLGDNRKVFAPAVDSAQVRKSAAAWQAEPSRTRFLFYGRPGHPRNLFDIGIEAIRRWTNHCSESFRNGLILNSIGSPHNEISLGNGLVVHSLGKLSLDGYFEELSRTDIGMALMMSPHPSHLALEMPMAGIPTLTNAFHDSRVAWYPRLLVKHADATSLAQGLSTIADQSHGLVTHEYEGSPAVPLGLHLKDAIQALCRAL